MRDNKRITIKIFAIIITVFYFHTTAYSGTLTATLDSILAHAPPDTVIWAIATTTLQPNLADVQIDSTLTLTEIYDRKIAYLRQVARQIQEDILFF